jgi:hypothetical protein
VDVNISLEMDSGSIAEPTCRNDPQGAEGVHNTYMRSIHQTRNIATMAPAMWMIQSLAVFGFPKLNMRQW